MGDRYVWRFKSVGGTSRVDISTGEDIRHLGELDKKLWTVLSCPAGGLEFDRKTLELLDTDKDGKIKSDEVVTASVYLTSALRDAGLLLTSSDTISLSDFNLDDENGRKLHDSALRILKNKGLDKSEISLADAADSVSIFAGSKFNGDGVITPASADDESLKKTIADAVATTGGSMDRSGETGVTAEQIEAFYAACADYSAWVKAGESSEVLPYGDATEAALEAVSAVKDKVADYFMRCRLSAFDSDATSALDVQVDEVKTIGAGDLARSGDAIAALPLARVNSEGKLPLGALNPAWEDAFGKVKALVLDKDCPGAETLDEPQWKAVLAKLGAYSSWKDAEKGASVESLGRERVAEILSDGEKDRLLELVKKDKALKTESDSIDDVERFLRLYRDFYTLLRNYVTFDDFYDKDAKAIFQAGRLYIDQRSLDLCIRVEDMARHGDMAALSGMYIIYCACTSCSGGKSMNIAAVLTDGDVNNLRMGMNAVFYDRDGRAYDATVTRLVDNPVSIRQAFWSPYNKLSNVINERINKSAAEKENKSVGGLLDKANTVSLDPAKAKSGDEAAAPAGKKFDIATFCGIFAALGMAISYITTAFVSLAKGISQSWYTLPLLIVLIILCISGPSMFIAWRKLRKRNLAPLLNANGWAINAHILVNIGFGAGLTSLASFPALSSIDPKAMKSEKRRKRWSRAVIVLLILACGAVFWSLCSRKKAVEASPVPATSVEAVEAPAPVAEPAAPAEPVAGSGDAAE